MKSHSIGGPPRPAYISLSISGMWSLVMCTYTVKTKLCISNFDMFVKVVKDLTHALIWYAVAMLLLFVQGEYTVLPLLYLLCIWWNKAVEKKLNVAKVNFWQLHDNFYCTTKCQCVLQSLVPWTIGLTVCCEYRIWNFSFQSIVQSITKYNHNIMSIHLFIGAEIIYFSWYITW